MWSERDSGPCPGGPPKLSNMRQQLRTKIGDAFNIISTMFGGRPHDNQGKRKGWSINRNTLNAMLDFAEISKGFSARETEG